MSKITRLKSFVNLESSAVAQQQNLGSINQYVLNMRQVKVNSKTRKNILSIDNFAVRPGELVAVLGPNGAGKSTLLRTINMLQPYCGEMQLFGQDVRNANQTLLRRRSALVFQETLLLDDTVFNNVARVLQFRGVPKHQIKHRVYTVLETFGCEHLAHRQARALSGGEGKRVCIACGLVADAELLLLDEPSASLDVAIRPQIIEKIRQWAQARGAAVILVSHNFTDILHFADRAIALFDGCIVQDDKLETLIRRPANQQIARLVGMDNIIKCQLQPNKHGYLIKLANSIEFSYFGEVKTPITACCLSGDAFYIDDASYSIPYQSGMVTIEGRVERIVRGIGTHTIRVKVGEETLTARVPRSDISDNVYHNAMIKLAFNPKDAHFV
ncbi:MULTISPECIES: ABC transporter ATP-binding protein [Fischerella]|uniref:ABC transporter ATP-binding protein n=1 Tax=Fischerella TaxID=1190 RepID=UPI000373DFB0|nr:MULTISPECIES: energy-coupling factor ABC transporter ATP-binding protein [Fischerella]MBD2434504.1 energy-coupling factor ABC transporter ATP-binding protein [Fischerella sp. FACHB-380]